MSKQPILYIKDTCGWCLDALQYFKKHRLELDVRDIKKDHTFRAEMEQISGQSKVPTFVYGNFVVPDFDIGEFETALKQHPKIKEELKL